MRGRGSIVLTCLVCGDLFRSTPKYATNRTTCSVECRREWLSKPLQEAVDRFWAKVFKSDGCWAWTASLGPTGYGQFSQGRRVWKAHRFAWLLTNGDPGSLCVLHKCDNPICVRPDHLFLGTNQDNVDDMMAKGRHRSQRQRAEAHS